MPHPASIKRSLADSDRYRSTQCQTMARFPHKTNVSGQSDQAWRNSSGFIRATQLYRSSGARNSGLLGCPPRKENRDNGARAVIYDRDAKLIEFRNHFLFV